MGRTGGFKAGFRGSSDPDSQDLAFIEMELWDGDPLNAFDSTGIDVCNGTSLAGRMCADDGDCNTDIYSGQEHDGWFCGATPTASWARAS